MNETMRDLTDGDVDRYLQRIGFRSRPDPTLANLEALQRAHLTAVPFENLHVFHRLGVSTDVARSIDKVVTRRRGGWCFELNGAFAALLRALGYSVHHFGAAVLLDGPNDLIDHLTLQVTLEEPWLVDVGFGDSFIRPLALNDGEPQDGGTGTYQFLPSPKGTTLAALDEGVPVAKFRFKRVAHELDEFAGASQRLQTDESAHWLRWPFATRLIEGGPDRVTLLADRLKLTRDAVTTEAAMAAGDWDATLEEWFSMTVPESVDD